MDTDSAEAVALAADTKMGPIYWSVRIGAVLLLTAIPMAISYGVATTRVDDKLELHDRRLDANKEKREKLEDRVQAIDERTSRMEGQLDELVKHVRYH